MVDETERNLTNARMRVIDILLNNSSLYSSGKIREIRRFIVDENECNLTSTRMRTCESALSVVC